MRWHRDQYISHMLFQGSEREWFSELFGPLGPLEKEWRAQGATEEQIGMTAFDWDYVDTLRLAAATGSVTHIEPVVLEDTPEYRLATDHLGRHTKLIKSSATIALPMDFPITCPEDWEKVRSWYTFSEERIDREKLAAQKAVRDNGALFCMEVPGAFDELRELMGEELTCISYYEEPELIHEILDTIAATAEKVIERAGAILPIDALIIHEDMAGRSGPMIGPNIIREFCRPYYQRLWKVAQAYGAKLFSMDSDGDVSPILEELVASGVNCIHPCEPCGGMDVVELRKKFGNQIAFKGGIDKLVLRGSKEDIRRELEYRMDPVLFGGGMIFGIDHRIPNGVPLENYLYYVKLGREMLGLPPIGSNRGWGRMAF